jgi:hypothetical protein
MVENTDGQVANTAGQETRGGDDDDNPRLRLDLDLDVEVDIKAEVHGDVTLSLL